MMENVSLRNYVWISLYLFFDLLHNLRYSLNIIRTIV
jgi:hypothetical protein